MNRNEITPNRVWACMVLVLAAAISITAQERGTLRLTEESAAELHSLEPTRRERVAEVMPAINMVSISTSKKSVMLSGIANIVREEAFGVQIGGLYNHVGGMGRGLAIAGLGNTTLGSYYGTQIGGLSNYNADDSKGLMIGGLSNVVGGGMDGMQLAGLANIVKEAKGVQLAGVVNVAKEVCGLQLAGVVNVAKRVRGVQFASVLNVAEESDFPIGLVNIVKSGTMGVAITSDIVGNRLVSFRSGGRYTYGIVGVGCNQHITHKLVAEAGYGIHIPVCEWLQVNNEMKATAPVNTSFVNFSYLLAPSVTLWKHCNLFGGPSLNYNMAYTLEAERLWPRDVLWGKVDGDLRQCVYIGYQIGVQYVF